MEESNKEWTNMARAGLSKLCEKQPWSGNLSDSLTVADGAAWSTSTYMERKRKKTPANTKSFDVCLEAFVLRHSTKHKDRMKKIIIQLCTTNWNNLFPRIFLQRIMKFLTNEIPLLYVVLIHIFCTSDSGYVAYDGLKLPCLTHKTCTSYLNGDSKRCRIPNWWIWELELSKAKENNKSTKKLTPAS